MNQTFDMDALRTMITGVELGSFSRAANHLGRSQSAISMQLKKLEEQTGEKLFVRKGRGLEPTEPGEALLSYARRIIALNDEAAAALGTAVNRTTVRLGLPQDYFEDLLPAVMDRFSHLRPGVHLEVRAGRNHMFEEEVLTGRLDAAIAFFEHGVQRQGTHIADLPLHWYGAKEMKRLAEDILPLVMYDHPCLFRKTALQALDQAGRKWRLALTTPSLPGVWGAVRGGHGISVRTGKCVPDGIADIGGRCALPDLPPVELRMLSAHGPSAAASDLCDTVRAVAQEMAG